MKLTHSHDVPKLNGSQLPQISCAVTTNAHWKKRKAIKKNHELNKEIFDLQETQRQKNKNALNDALKKQKIKYDSENAAAQKIIDRVKELQFIKEKTGKNFTPELKEELTTKNSIFLLSQKQRAEYLQELTIKKQITQINKQAIETEKTKFKNSLLYLQEGSGGYSDLLKNAERDLQRAKNDSNDIGIKKAEKRIKYLQIEANKTGQLKNNYGSLFTAANEAKGMITNVGKTAIEAALMEGSKLKELGKSRAQIVKEAVASILKSKAVEYGVKAFGSAAEGTISLVTAPPAAPAFFKAAGLYTAAAAVAAGVAYKGMSKSSGSSGAGKSASSQAPSYGGTESKGTNINITITESVMGGSMDVVAEKLKSIIDDGQSRGTVSQWSN